LTGRLSRASAWARPYSLRSWSMVWMPRGNAHFVLAAGGEGGVHVQGSGTDLLRQERTVVPRCQRVIHSSLSLAGCGIEKIHLPPIAEASPGYDASELIGVA
jgi:hypothetical protein